MSLIVQLLHNLDCVFYNFAFFDSKKKIEFRYLEFVKACGEQLTDQPVRVHYSCNGY